MNIDEKVIKLWREECAEDRRNRTMIFADEWRQLCDLALRGLDQPEANAHEWTWSLDEPFVTGWQWIETWSENTLTFNVLRFHVGDKLDKDVACWRFIEPPKGSPTPQNTQESK